MDASGNYAIATTDLTVNVYLKKRKLMRSPEIDLGATEIAPIPLEGYIISIDELDPDDPQVLPETVRGGARGQATFIGEWQQSGEFILEESIPNPFSIESFGVSIEDILGRKLEGYLVVTTAWGNQL